MENKTLPLAIFVNVFDEASDLLGFFPARVVEICKYRPVLVIAQHVGRYSPLVNLRVVDLNKTVNAGRWPRFKLALGTLYTQRRAYGDILVIMAPAWAVLIGIWALVLRKRVFLWYAVWSGTWKLRLAERMVTKILTSVPEAFPFPSSKVIAIGQGIDVDQFKTDDQWRQPGSIVFVGRISRVKKIELLLPVLKTSLTLIGTTKSADDELYLAELKKIIVEKDLQNIVTFSGKVAYHQIAYEYQKADIFVNMTPTGSFDKTILEAMASGCLVIASNSALRRFMSQEMQEHFLFRENDRNDLSRILEGVLSMSFEEKERYRKEFRELVVTNHSQEQWTKKLIQALES